ncbi:DUF4149 domain-containing protein [Rhodopila sp.]|uniref:DUF4149 domain-containing protein n=1 Tax=Rhodopila sp. TaxID=2480087 RepID=UPI003D0B7620
MSDLIALFALALLLGGMVFFAAVIAPLVFTRLPAPQAGGFIRAVFPFYYLYVFLTSAVAALALAPLPAAVAVALIAAMTIWLRQWLMPRINVFSDAAQAGDRAAKHRFDRAHRLSVAVNLAQMLIAGGVLVRFTSHGG